MSVPHRTSVLLEAILFASAQPLTAQRLGGVLQLPEADIQDALLELDQALKQRGIELVGGVDGYELEVKAGLRSEVAEALSDQAQPLSTAALEVLTIVAYQQPVTKAQVDEIRGIASDASVRALLARDLITHQGKHEGLPLYRTTNQFLKSLGLTGLDQLTPLPEVADDTAE